MTASRLAGGVTHIHTAIQTLFGNLEAELINYFIPHAKNHRNWA